MDQSRLGSLVETCVNTFLGFVITLIISPIIYPLFGHSFTMSQNVAITLIFTVVSVLRGYVVRRWFNYGIKKFATMIASLFK